MRPDPYKFFMLLINNTAIDKTQLPQLGATITGTATTVTIDDIITAEGPRIPNSTNSQKEFKIGFVLLTQPGGSVADYVTAIETIRTAWAGRFAALTSGAGKIKDVTPSLTLTIDSPADNATIAGPDVTVSGAVINTTGAETGITVNGIPATVSGSRFIANHVPLTEGQNTITITATDVNNLTATATRTVTATASDYLRIVPNVESGTAPLCISISLDASFSIATPTVSISGPVSVQPVAGATTTEFTATLPVEGTYTINASAVGPENQMYSDTVTITVMSETNINRLFQNKWNKLTGSLAINDNTTALSVISSQARQMYQDMFTALAGQLPAIIATQREFNLISVTQGQGKYELVTQENGTIYSYDVIFSREDNGLWALDVF